jgi:hypothetical protein
VRRGGLAGLAIRQRALCGPCIVSETGLVIWPRAARAWPWYRNPLIGMRCSLRDEKC